MSKEAFIRFRDAVMQSVSLQTELVNTVKSQADLLALAKRLGFDVDPADLESRELTEEELTRVAGGALTFGGGLSVGGHEKWAPVEKWVDVSAFNIFVNTFPK